MSLVDANAKTGSLKNDYGTGHGTSSPATFYVAVFSDAAMTNELTGTGGIPRIPISNVDAQLATPGTTTSNVNTVNSSASTGAWAATGQYAALMSTASGAGDKWDGGALTNPVTVAGAGTVISIAAGQLQISQP
jgi:hypothetical protein